MFSCSTCLQVVDVNGSEEIDYSRLEDSLQNTWPFYKGVLFWHRQRTKELYQCSVAVKLWVKEHYWENCLNQTFQSDFFFSENFLPTFFVCVCVCECFTILLTKVSLSPYSRRQGWGRNRGWVPDHQIVNINCVDVLKGYPYWFPFFHQARAADK